MSVQRKRGHVQGSVDGLCGIYCLVHFFDHLPKISERAKTSKPKAAFRSLLRSAESLKCARRKGKTLLSFDNITDGYYTDDLVRIFNATTARKRLPYRAEALSDLVPATDERSFGEIIRSYLKQDAQIILQIFGTDHYVLAYEIDDDGDILVKDSGHSEKYRRSELKKAPKSYDCVILARSNSAIFKAVKT